MRILVGAGICARGQRRSPPRLQPQRPDSGQPVRDGGEDGRPEGAQPSDRRLWEGEQAGHSGGKGKVETRGFEEKSLTIIG